MYKNAYGPVLRPGFKMFNFLSDSLNICSFRGWNEPTLITSIFKAFNALLTNMRFKSLVFHGTNVNLPLFTFASKPLGTICTKAINGFLTEVVNSRSFYDLMQGYNLTE